MSIFSLLSGTLSAISKSKAGEAENALRIAQAKQAGFTARRDVLKANAAALNSRLKGIAVLKETRKNMSLLVARTAAGGMDPFSGSIAHHATANYKSGVGDFFTTKRNSEMAELDASFILASGDVQQLQLRKAGKIAQRQGYMQATAIMFDTIHGEIKGGGFSLGGGAPSVPDGSGGGGK